MAMLAVQDRMGTQTKAKVPETMLAAITMPMKSYL
jgi:hypothetical protein